MIFNRTQANIFRKVAFRAICAVFVMVTPIMASQAINATGKTIEAPVPKNSGAGFVLLMGIRRGG